MGESGLFTPHDLARLSRCGVNAFLIGESLMRQPDVTAATQAKAELAVDRIRDKFGRAAVARGIGFGQDDESE